MPKYHEFGKLFGIWIYLVFSISYLAFSIRTLLSGKQVLHITIFVILGSKYVTNYASLT